MTDKEMTKAQERPRALHPLHLIVREWVLRQYATKMADVGGGLTLKARHNQAAAVWEGRLPRRESSEFEAFDADNLIADCLNTADADAANHASEGVSGFWVYYLYSYVGESITPDLFTSLRIYKERPADDSQGIGGSVGPVGGPSLAGGGETETLIRQTQMHLENRDKITLSKDALFIQGIQALFQNQAAALARHEAREAVHFQEMRYAADRRNELEMVLFHEEKENEKNRQLGQHWADILSKFTMLYVADQKMRKMQAEAEAAEKAKSGG